MKIRRYKVYLSLALLVAFGGLAAVIVTGTSPRLGLDLEGGTSITYTAVGENVNSDVLEQTVEIIRQRIDALGVAEPEVAAVGADNLIVQLPSIKNEERARRVIGSTAQLTFRQVAEVFSPATPDKKLPEVTKSRGGTVTDEEVVYPSGQEGEQGTLYRLEPAILTGDIITKASAVLDTQSGGWSTTLDMNDKGSETWANFTGRLACLRDEGEQIKSQVAIVLDGRVESAAGMQQVGAGGGGVECDTGIAGGQTQITVGDEAEAKDLALILKTGALPITLRVDELVEVSPTLGQDSLDAGLRAGAIGLGLVMIYIVIYYRGLGLITWVGLLVFTAIIYTLMSLLGESVGLSLSLAGVAGIIVSIGITTDSYIVAFERLKDEVRAGKTMRAAVERGMTRAFRTILVADFVTGAAAVILFFLAVGSVRGFALTLGLATIVDVLVAYFFTRSAVHLLLRTRLFSSGRFIGMREALGAER